MLPAKFGSIWPSSFRGEDLFNISQSETRIALGSHICWPNGTKRRNFIGIFIWFHSANKYGHQEQFFFLIG
jgi:hypothetical protein